MIGPVSLNHPIIFLLVMRQMTTENFPHKDYHLFEKENICRVEPVFNCPIPDNHFAVMLSAPLITSCIPQTMT